MMAVGGLTGTNWFNHSYYDTIVPIVVKHTEPWSVNISMTSILTHFKSQALNKKK